MDVYQLKLDNEWAHTLLAPAGGLDGMFPGGGGGGGGPPMPGIGGGGGGGGIVKGERRSYGYLEETGSQTWGREYYRGIKAIEEYIEE